MLQMNSCRQTGKRINPDEDEIESLLVEICDKENINPPVIWKESILIKINKATGTAKEVRRQAMETAGETKENVKGHWNWGNS